MKPIKIMLKTLKYLRYHNAWPPEGEELKPGLGYIVRALFSFFSAATLLMMTIISLYYTLKYNAGRLIYDSTAELTSLFGCTYICFMSMRKQRDLAILYSDMSSFGEFGEPPRHTERQNYLDRLSTFNYIYSTTALSFRGIMLWYGVSECEKHDEVPLVCGTYIVTMSPYKITSKPIRICIFLWQFIVVFNIVKGSSTFSFTEYEVIQYLVTRIRHLEKMFSSMFQSSSKEHQRKNLIKCVKYHQEIIRYAQRIDGCYRNTMFIHILVTAGIFGVVGNLVIQEKKMEDMLHLIGWIIALLLVCHAGQILITEYDTIQYAVYNSNWYSVDVDLQKKVRFILAMAQRPLYVRAGPFGVLSYLLFGGIVKTSYSVVTLIQKT